MKQLFNILAITVLMASLTTTSCSLGYSKGDQRDRNLSQVTQAHLDSVQDIKYVGMSDAHELDGNRVQAVVIYYVMDSLGNKIERNARVTTNYDCSEIYAWEDLDTKVLEDVKQKVSDKFEEKGISIDDSLIDVLIEMKKR